MPRSIQLGRLWPSESRVVPTRLSFRIHSSHRTITPALHLRHNASSTADPNKPIVLEQPDKFRPPSHPQRLSRRAPRQYPGPPLSQEELAAQKTKRYPHTFPSEGTFTHWFLTNRKLHLIITLTTLTTLAVVSIVQNFLHSSPFAHLLPALSTLPRHPLAYLSDTLGVLRMHQDYQTELSAARRRAAILDTQKQRLYRRAHGIEDLDAEEESGVDVRGLVPWDDGLTKKEREMGGRSEELTHKMAHEVQMRDGQGGWVRVADVLEKEMKEQRMAEENSQEDGRVVVAGEEEGPAERIPPRQPQEQEQSQQEPAVRRKRPRYFGIW